MKIGAELWQLVTECELWEIVSVSLSRHDEDDDGNDGGK